VPNSQLTSNDPQHLYPEIEGGVATPEEDSEKRARKQAIEGLPGIWPYPCLLPEYKRQKRHFSVTLNKYWYA